MIHGYVGGWRIFPVFIKPEGMGWDCIEIGSQCWCGDVGAEIPSLLQASHPIFYVKIVLENQSIVLIPGPAIFSRLETPPTLNFVLPVSTWSLEWVAMPLYMLETMMRQLSYLITRYQFLSDKRRTDTNSLGYSNTSLAFYLKL